MWSIGDSNPARGNYSNAVKAFAVIIGVIGLLLLGLMFITGHAKAAVGIVVAISFISLIVRALRSTGGGS